MITFRTKLMQLPGNVYYLGLYVTAAQAKEVLSDNKERRVICTIEDASSWHAALMPLGDGDFFINVNKAVRKKLDLEEGQENIPICLEKDESEYGMELPEELAELWAIDTEASEVFHQLTRGKQRSLIYQIGKSKRSETRLKKAVLVMDYLKSTGGKLDFKELNMYMKER